MYTLRRAIPTSRIRTLSAVSRCSTETVSSCGSSVRLEPGRGRSQTRHAMASDSQGGLIAADRHNHRIQILTKEGRYLGEWWEFSRVSGLTIDGSDMIYAADSESDAKRHPGWLKGIRIG